MPIDELDRRLAELAEAAREHTTTPSAAVIRARARRRRGRRLAAGAAALAVVAALAVATRGALVPRTPDGGPSARPGPSAPPSTAPATAPRTVPWLREPARPRAPTPTVAGAHLADLAVSIDAPSRAVTGRPLRYSVTIANAGSGPLPLRPCPNYDQRLAVEGARPVLQPWRLNCTTLAAIAPGERVTFAMRLDVPATLPPGRAVLIWNLDLGPGAQFKPIQVVRP